MKKFIKTIVSLTAASAMLLSTTAFAATTQTVTKYSANGTEVTSTVSGLTAGSMVTYLAHKENAVSANGDNIVYIAQETVDALGHTEETTTAAEDYLSSMLMELGIEGIEIEVTAVLRLKEGLNY